MQRPGGLPTVSHVGRLAAQALQASRRGAVVSVHHRAVNLQLEDGSVVGVLGEPRWLHPWAMVAALDPACLSVGQAVRCGTSVLEIGGTRLDLEGAVLSKLTLVARPRRMPRHSLAALRVRGERAAADVSPAVSAAVACFSGDGRVTSLADVVGLGEGLTPSGDDLLVGALAGLDLVSKACPGAGRLRRELVSALPAELALHTTRISAQAIAAAVEGMYAAPLLALLERISEPEPGFELDEAFIGLLAVGHRSGRDTLLGLAAACARGERLAPAASSAKHARMLTRMSSRP